MNYGNIISSLLKTGRESTGSDLARRIVQEWAEKTKRGVFRMAQPCPQGMNYLEDKVSLCNKGEHFRQWFRSVDSMLHYSDMNFGKMWDFPCSRCPNRPKQAETEWSLVLKIIPTWISKLILSIGHQKPCWGRGQNTGQTEPSALGVTLPSFSKGSGREQLPCRPLESLKWNPA